MRTSQIDCNNISFEKLRIKINGEGFRRHPEDIKVIKDAIKNNEGITKFFETHTGKIILTAKEKSIPVKHYYPHCLREPGKPDYFTAEHTVPIIDISCTYNRAFALRNLFRKPVWIQAGTKANESTNWASCIKGALDCIRMLGKDTPEDYLKRGDTLPRDFFSVEERRLKVEKP